MAFCSIIFGSHLSFQAIKVSDVKSGGFLPDSEFKGFDPGPVDSRIPDTPTNNHTVDC